MKRNVHAVHAAGLSLDISFSSVFFFRKILKRCDGFDLFVGFTPPKKLINQKF